MPKPPRLCTCGQIVPHGTLCTCQIELKRARGRRHDQNRPNSRQRGYTREWEKARAEFLSLHSFCAYCGEQAQVVDHIQPHRSNKALFWNWNNWQALCALCHNSVKQRQEFAESRI